MAIKRYLANADNTITNAFKMNLTTRGTGSNMGQSDILEVFSIYQQASNNSLEKARALINFPVSDILTDRNAKTIPESGSVKFYLRVFNAPHGQTVPKNFDMQILPISRSWNEGDGLDMEEYTDSGPTQTSNWIKATNTQAWTTQGGDFHEVGYTAGRNLPHYAQRFTSGVEDLEVNITALVEEWMATKVNGDPDRENYGIALKLSGSYEDGSRDRSYYTKKFFSRSSEFFYKRPIVEARWDDSRRDSRAVCYKSSSLANGTDNLNTIYLYNYVRGKLANIPVLGANSGSNFGHTQINVQIFPSGNIKNQTIKPKTLPIGGGVTVDGATVITGGLVTTGIYSASFAFTGSEKEIFEVWSKPTQRTPGIQLVTGSVFKVKSFEGSNFKLNRTFTATIKNLKASYSQGDKARFRFFIRERGGQPNIFTVATNTIEPTIIENAYYRIFRIIDNLDVISFGTGSGQQSKYTRMSYDVNGNYFDLDMSLFESGYSYAIQVAYDVDDRFFVQNKTFKFRVD